MATQGNAIDESTLCARCGLCCDGSLFRKVWVLPEEIEPLRDLGLDVDAAERPFFKQPCDMLAGRLCSIYAERPHTCRRFACALLKRVRVGEVSLAEAEGTVAAAHALRAKVAVSMPDGANLGEQIAAVLREDMRATADPDEKRAAAVHQLDHFALGRYLKKHFYVSKPDAQSKPASE